jgi:hypothetical protein
MQIASTTLLLDGNDAGEPPDKKHLKIMKGIVLLA